MSQTGFFDFQNRLSSLEQTGDPLERLNRLIPWETFRPVLAILREKDRKSSAGRKPFDTLLMFKMLVLQRLYNLSDHQVEFQSKDRLSFMRFLQVGLEDTIPDEKTLWTFREELSKLGLELELFERFDKYLEYKGVKAKQGTMVDATIIEVPKQRNSREENAEIKAGKIPDALSENENILRQKDLDARWTKKHGRSFYGYKDHVVVDSGSKLVLGYTVTPASVHDSQELPALMKKVKRGQSVYGDSAYADEKKELEYERQGKYCLFVMRGRKEWKEWNQMVSGVRARVEHVFGTMEKAMGGKFLRAIGLRRNRAAIGLMNLVYNMKRYAGVLCPA